MDKSTSLEKKRKRLSDLMLKFYNFVNQLAVCLLPEHPNELDAKEIKYVAEYLNHHFAQVVDMHQLYHRLPILSITIYGDHTGKANIIVDPSQNKEIAVNFRLPKLVKDLKAVTDKWELDVDKPPETEREKSIRKLSKLEDQQLIDLAAYQAIQEHLKEDK